MSEPVSGHRILLISYHFPPSAAVGGQRMANFARGLSSYGWSPAVLTIADRDIERLDPDRLRGLQHLTIHKAPAWRGPLAWVAALKRGPGRRARPAAVPPPACEPERAGARRLRRWILSFLVCPDAENGWIVPATRDAVRIVRRDGVGWVATSCPPYSVHVIGLAVKALTGCKWLADFRDPWMTTGSKRLYPTSALSLKLERWLERKVMERADLVVFNVARLRDAYQQRYARLPAEKFVFIPNGITPADFGATPRAPKYDAFTLSYTGSLYVGRSPEPVFAAIRQLLDAGVVDTASIRVKLVGECRSLRGLPIDDVIGRYGLKEVVEVTDAVSYTDAFDIIRRSDLALLFAPNLPFQIPAKAYDYLGAGTRILAIAEEGSTADFVRDTGAGEAFSPGDVNGIARFLRSELQSRGRGAAAASVALRRLDIATLTGELVSHLRPDVVHARSEAVT